MIVATDAQPDNDHPPQAVKVPLPSREQITAMQLQTLVHTAVMLNQLRGAPDEDGNRPDQDGGVKCAVDTSLIKLCDRVDKILETDARWDLAVHGKLEKKLNDVYSKHLELLQTQKEVFEEMTALHKDVKPTFVRLDNGQWAAMIGDPTDMAKCLIGVGDSAADALEDFINKFYKRKNEKQ